MLGYTCVTAVPVLSYCTCYAILRVHLYILTLHSEMFCRGVAVTWEGRSLQGEAYATRNHKLEVTRTSNMTSEIRRIGDLHYSN